MHGPKELTRQKETIYDIYHNKDQVHRCKSGVIVLAFSLTSGYGIEVDRAEQLLDITSVKGGLIVLVGCTGAFHLGRRGFLTIY